MPMLVTDARHEDNPIVLANQAFLNLTGYTSAEVLGRNCRFLQGEGTSPAAVAQIRSGLAGGRELNVEILNYRKDGSAFWNQLHISPIHDDDGKPIYHFASQVDVTEFRKVQSLEASEHRLLREVDHRAKNVLAVVDGIVRLSNAEDPSRYAASVQQRVQALASAHALLADQGWRDIPLRQIINEQIAHFASDRTTLLGPDVLVSALAVQPLALVIHELIVNAAVHGALATTSGRLAITWNAARPEGGFQLQWEETGAAPSVYPKGRGFGTTMVDLMIEKQLHGEIRRQWTDRGLNVEITVPKSSPH